MICVSFFMFNENIKIISTKTWTVEWFNRKNVDLAAIIIILKDYLIRLSHNISCKSFIGKNCKSSFSQLFKCEGFNNNLCTHNLKLNYVCELDSEI